MTNLGHHIALPDRDHLIVSQMATAGYFVALNYTRHGAEYLATNYPAEWVSRYEEKALMWFDPIVLFSMAKQGTARWSEIRLPDVAKVRAQAEEFGLKYGAVLSKKTSRGRCVFSVARLDREFANSEIGLLKSWFEVFIQSQLHSENLSEILLQALKLAAQGFTVDQAARREGCSVSAMKTRLKNARKALSAATTSQAVAIAIRRKMI